MDIKERFSKTLKSFGDKIKDKLDLMSEEEKFATILGFECYINEELEKCLVDFGKDEMDNPSDYLVGLVEMHDIHRTLLDGICDIVRNYYNDNKEKTNENVC